MANQFIAFKHKRPIKQKKKKKKKKKSHEQGGINTKTWTWHDENQTIDRYDSLETRSVAADWEDETRLRTAARTWPEHSLRDGSTSDSTAAVTEGAEGAEEPEKCCWYYCCSCYGYWSR